MEFWLQKLVALILSVLFLLCACADDVGHTETLSSITDSDYVDVTTCTIAGIISDSATSLPDISQEQIDVELDDGFYFIRVYAVDECFTYSDNSLIMTVGVENNETHYYTNEDLQRYSVGDVFEVDGELSFEIESLEVESNVFVKNRYYSEEIIRLNDNFIMRHPGDDGSNDYYLVKDFWILNYVRCFDGESERQLDLQNVTNICIQDSCLIKCDSYDELSKQYIKNTLEVFDTKDFVIAQKEKIGDSLLAIYANIRIENGKIIELNFWPYMYEGRFVCTNE